MWIQRSPVQAREAVPSHKHPDIPGVMKLAVISDIHSNIAALEAVLDDIGRHGIKDIVNLGDCLSGPFDAVATADRLMALDIPTVRGNHDRMLYDGTAGLWESWVLDDLSPGHLDWVREYPLTISLGDVLLCHATPDNDAENWLNRRGPEQRLVSRDMAGIIERAGECSEALILCGHTHEPRSVTLPGGRRVVNPGSVGVPAYKDTRVEPPFIHQTGSPDARYAVVEAKDADWIVTHISVPYDAEPMAKMAEQKGADSWARAVRAGWFV